MYLLDTVSTNVPTGHTVSTNVSIGYTNSTNVLWGVFGGIGLLDLNSQVELPPQQHHTQFFPVLFLASVDSFLPSLSSLAFHVLSLCKKLLYACSAEKEEPFRHWGKSMSPQAWQWLPGQFPQDASVCLTFSCAHARKELDPERKCEVRSPGCSSYGFGVSVGKQVWGTGRRQVVINKENVAVAVHAITCLRSKNLKTRKINSFMWANIT